MVRSSKLSSKGHMLSAVSTLAAKKKGLEAPNMQAVCWYVFNMLSQNVEYLGESLSVFNHLNLFWVLFLSHSVS